MNTWSQRFNDALLFDAFTQRADPGSCDTEIPMLTAKDSMVIVAPLTGLCGNMYKNIQSPDFQYFLSMLTMQRVANWLNCGKNTTFDLFRLDLTANHRAETYSATANQSVVYSFKHVCFFDSSKNIFDPGPFLSLSFQPVIIVIRCLGSRNRSCFLTRSSWNF